MDVEKRYQSLLEEFCKLAAIDNVALVKETGNLVVDEVNFSLVSPAALGEYPGMLVFGELGGPPEMSKEERYRRMLTMNLLTGFEDGPRLAVNPENDTEVIMFRLRLDDLDAQRLAQSLKFCARMVLAWRNGVDGLAEEISPPGPPARQTARAALAISGKKF